MFNKLENFGVALIFFSLSLCVCAFFFVFETIDLTSRRRLIKKKSFVWIALKRIKFLNLIHKIKHANMYIYTQICIFSTKFSTKEYLFFAWICFHSWKRLYSAFKHAILSKFCMAIKRKTTTTATAKKDRKKLCKMKRDLLVKLSPVQICSAQNIIAALSSNWL